MAVVTKTLYVLQRLHGTPALERREFDSCEGTLPVVLVIPLEAADAIPLVSCRVRCCFNTFSTGRDSLRGQQS